jgi:DNA-binding transcriptional LysR family regulator
VTSQGLQRTLIFEESLYLVVSINHELGTRNTVELQDLFDVDLLALGQAYELHDTVMTFAAKAGARVQFDYAETSIDTLSAMVATNAGASILPGFYVHDVIRQDSRLKTFEISHLCPPRPITMSWRKGRAGQEHLERLANLIREAVLSNFRTQARTVAINGGRPVL